MGRPSGALVVSCCKTKPNQRKPGAAAALFAVVFHPLHLPIPLPCLGFPFRPAAPLLAPFLLLIPSSCFLLYSTLLYCSSPPTPAPSIHPPRPPVGGGDENLLFSSSLLLVALWIHRPLMPRRFDPSPPRTRTKAPPPAVELVPTSSSSSALRLRLRLIKGCNFVAGRTDGRTDAAEQRQTQIHLI